jgi:hypothetical protein
VEDEAWVRTEIGDSYLRVSPPTPTSQEKAESELRKYGHPNQESLVSLTIEDRERKMQQTRRQYADAAARSIDEVVECMFKVSSSPEARGSSSSDEPSLEGLLQHQRLTQEMRRSSAASAADSVNSIDFNCSSRSVLVRPSSRKWMVRDRMGARALFRFLPSFVQQSCLEGFGSASLMEHRMVTVLFIVADLKVLTPADYSAQHLPQLML